MPPGMLTGPFFFFQAEDGIRAGHVTGVQTCALPICVFSEAGFEWRNAGCSMCHGMNPDVLQSGERCASTSNRNFEGRQGRGGRTHLMSPPMAAAAAVAGHIVDVRRWGDGGGEPGWKH